MSEAIETHNLDAKDWIIIALGIIILLLGFGCGIYYHKYQKAEGQVVIWNDSAHIYKNKYNEEYTAKNTYILKIINKAREWQKTKSISTSSNVCKMLNLLADEYLDK